MVGIESKKSRCKARFSDRSFDRFIMMSPYQNNKYQAHETQLMGSKLDHLTSNFVTEIQSIENVFEHS